MADLLKNNVFKSLLYILSFGGLLKLSGMLLTWLWNSYISLSFDLDEITFLESVGIISFSYILFAGIRYGFGTNADKISPYDKMSCKYIYKSEIKLENATKINENLRNLTQDEKEKLKKVIAKCCGFEDIPNNININSQVEINSSHKVIK